MATFGLAAACHSGSPLSSHDRPCQADAECATPDGALVEVGAAAPLPAIAPDTISGLALWLDATRGVVTDGASRVETWDDRGPLGHRARADGLGPIAFTDPDTQRPVVRFALNGDRAIRMVVSDHPSLQWGTGDFTIAAAVKYRNNPVPGESPDSWGMIYGKQSLERPFLGPALFGNDGWFLASSAATAIQFQTSAFADHSIRTAPGQNDGRPHVVVAQRRGLSITLRLDGVLVSRKIPSTQDDVSALGTVVSIGANATSVYQQLVGDIFDLAAFGPGPNEADVAAVERFLAARAGVTLVEWRPMAQPSPRDAATSDALSAIQDAPVTMDGGVSNAPLVRPPDVIAGLALWLDATRGVTMDGSSRVKTWDDRGPHGHRARPTGPGPIVLDDPGTHRSVLSFALVGDEAVRMIVPDHPSLQWGTGDFTIAAAVKYRNPTVPNESPDSVAMIYGKQSLSRPFTGPALFGNDAWFITNATAATATQFQTAAIYDHTIRTGPGQNDGRPHVVVAQRQGQSLILRLDGMLVSRKIPSTHDDVSSPGAAVSIGANGTSVLQQLTGEIFDLIAFGPGPTDDDVAALERFLAARANVTLAPGQ